jgi:hypothetical protein
LTLQESTLKNLFTTETFIACIIVFYSQIANTALDEWTLTGEISNKTIRDLLRQTVYAALVGYARYKGDNNLYTPKGLPGRSK